jgi:hypothetical protein
VLAFEYANNAPDVDLVLAIANSTTYGGVGYPSLDLATSAGANSAAIEIVRHEFGHALGNLADEYDYADGTTYTGGEPAQADASKLTSAQMAADSKKWFRWLGVNNPAFDGLVSTFEGAIYCQFGVYRPTNNSLMRNLNRPFNLPSAEQVILQIYHIVKPIDDASPTGTIYAGTETLFVTPVTPTGNPLAIQWYKDGVAIPGATGPTLDLSTLSFGACPSTVSVTVRDTTAWVRDEAACAQWMTESRAYTVATAGTGFSNVCVTTPNSAGPGAVMDHVRTNSLAANDAELVTYGCPPNKTGIYFFGASQAQAPLGNGVRCVAAPFSASRDPDERARRRESPAGFATPRESCCRTATCATSSSGPRSSRRRALTEYVRRPARAVLSRGSGGIRDSKREPGWYPARCPGP